MHLYDAKVPFTHYVDALALPENVRKELHKAACDERMCQQLDYRDGDYKLKPSDWFFPELVDVDENTLNMMLDESEETEEDDAKTRALYDILVEAYSENDEQTVVAIELARRFILKHVEVPVAVQALMYTDMLVINFCY